MNPKDSFTGFPKKCVTFLNNLKKNNNKDWFTEHKKEYQEHVILPSQRFVIEMGKKLSKKFPEIIADPRHSKSIFRIYRDVRFSKDKRPYKTHLGILFWEGSQPKLECSGFYFHLEPPNLMLGTGIYMFSRKALSRYRDSVVHPQSGKELIRIIKSFNKKGKYLIGGKHYKRVPRGYDPDHPNVEMLLFNGLYTMVDTKIPDEFYSKDILPYCYNIFKEMSPLHVWLRKTVE